MRVCLILEGSYPYVYGGVSSWTHHFIERSPDIEFVLWCVDANASQRGRFVYKLPPNVVEVREVSLDDALRAGGRRERRRGRLPRKGLSEAEREALGQLVACKSPDWSVLRGLVLKTPGDPDAVLFTQDYIEALEDFCRSDYPNTPFAQLFYATRSMMLPVLHLLAQDVPQADLYHAVCTGYAGLLACVAKRATGRPLVLTEHGIYSREREEELIRATWVEPYLKRLWIRHFYMLSSACYASADRITSLFSRARETQIELGADAAKCLVISNGIDYERFSRVPAKEPDGWVDIGAPIRLAPIKDVKTLLNAFYELSCRQDHVRLHICGSVDDEDYARECHELVKRLGLSDTVVFTGQVDMAAYMARFDFTVLSSISEGQPLSVLESFAAGRPMVTTNVGCCQELVEGGEGDELGSAGIVVAPMDYGGMANAMQYLAANPTLRAYMGSVGRRRAGERYRQEQMLKSYRDLYSAVMQEQEG